VRVVLDNSDVGGIAASPFRFDFGDLVDIALTPEGDIQITPEGDIALVRGEDVIYQHILWRLRTLRGDWVLEPDCGTDLRFMVGLPNNEETGDRVQAEVTAALTHDGFVPAELLTVAVAPESPDRLAVFIHIEGLSKILRFFLRLEDGGIEGWTLIDRAA